MGVSSSKENKEEEKYLKLLIKGYRNHCIAYLESLKKDFRNNKKQITKHLKQNDIYSAKKIMKETIEKENEFQAIRLFEYNFGKLHEKCGDLTSSKTCPKKLKGYLNNILYSINRIYDFNEFFIFEEKIFELYGKEYVNKAENNIDKLVSEDLIKYLEADISEELIMNRLKIIS